MTILCSASKLQEYSQIYCGYARQAWRDWWLEIQHVITYALHNLDPTFDQFLEYVKDNAKDHTTALQKRGKWRPQYLERWEKKARSTTLHSQRATIHQKADIRWKQASQWHRRWCLSRKRSSWHLFPSNSRSWKRNNGHLTHLASFPNPPWFPSTEISTTLLSVAWLLHAEKHDWFGSDGII